jgi:hypothetical protein
MKSIPLALAAAAFLAFVLWRIRPVLSGAANGRANREALRAAQSLAETATTGRERALALCDAAEAMSKTVSAPGHVSGLYLRALRADPTSVDTVRRTVAGLARRPRTLESLLWRHLGASPWTPESVPAVRASLDALASLYEGKLRNAARARALVHARDALQKG